MHTKEQTIETLATSAIVLVLAGTLVGWAPILNAEEIESSIARGGQLYDKWYELAPGRPPDVNHPSYPKEGKYSKNATWRCKECHGWDYKGKDGAYGKGKHYTGIKGIRAYDGGDPDKVIALLKDKTHGYTDQMMNEADFRDLANFVTKGQVDMDKYIDPATKEVKGNKERGAAYFNTICAGCHGRDGKKEDGDSVGKVAQDNPWEGLHKIRNAQPAEKMPAMRALPVDVAADILAHAMTLPK